MKYSMQKSFLNQTTKNNENVNIFNFQTKKKEFNSKFKGNSQFINQKNKESSIDSNSTIPEIRIDYLT